MGTIEISLIAGISFSFGCLIGGIIDGLITGSKLEEPEKFHTPVNINLDKPVDKLFIHRR